MKFYNELFQTLRESKCLTLEEIGRRLGISKQTVQKWEKGKATPKPINVYALAKILDVSAVDISDLKPESWLARNSDVAPVTEKISQFPVISEAAAAECNTAFYPMSDYASENAEDMVSFSNGRAGDFVIRVTGSSMLPWYPEGTLLLVRPQLPRTGQRVVAVLADGTVVFKVFAEKGDSFHLFSVNEDGKDFHFKKTDFSSVRGVYTVIQSMRDEQTLDNAMAKKGIHHAWQIKLEKL